MIILNDFCTGGRAGGRQSAVEEVLLPFLRLLHLVGGRTAREDATRGSGALAGYTPRLRITPVPIGSDTVPGHGGS